jgi:magnesium-transporting ATPase (P-type)
VVHFLAQHRATLQPNRGNWLAVGSDQSFLFFCKMSYESVTPLDVTQQVLDKLNVSQARVENKEFLDSIGGVESLLSSLNSSQQQGLSSESVQKMREVFGRNAFPESPMKSFFSLFFEALQDTTLLILIVAAIVSLIIGIWQHGAEEGWIEGGAILIAVFLVANVSAGNDYTKELQFRSLEKSSQGDERCSVIRDGGVERINPTDLVIGDIILLQVN